MTMTNNSHFQPGSRSSHILSDNQLSHILSLLESIPRMHDVRDVMMIILSTGLRAGEIRDLRWADVDLSLNTLSVRSKSSRVRTVSFGDETLRFLLARRQFGPDSTYVLGALPRAILYKVSRKMAALSVGIGIKRITMHSLRVVYLKRLSKTDAAT